MENSDRLYMELIAPIEGRMIGTVARIVRHPDDAADVFQEVQATIWKNLAKIHRHPNPHAYIMRICISRSYDCLRRRTRHRHHEAALDPELAEVLYPADRPKGDSQVSGETRNEIARAIGSLPACQGQALLLRVVEDTPYNVIADIMGCSETTARSHVSKARSRLKEILSRLGIL